MIEAAGGLLVADVGDVTAVAVKAGDCAFVFSALEMGKAAIMALEDSYAAENKLGRVFICNLSQAAPVSTADAPLDKTAWLIERLDDLGVDTFFVVADGAEPNLKSEIFFESSRKTKIRKF